MGAAIRRDLRAPAEALSVLLVGMDPAAARFLERIATIVLEPRPRVERRRGIRADTPVQPPGAGQWNPRAADAALLVVVVGPVAILDPASVCRVLMTLAPLQAASPAYHPQIVAAAPTGRVRSDWRCSFCHKRKPDPETNPSGSAR